ncbi:hypothetical protein JZ751_009059 [Albula glossodonta]|uniref:Uncharacterized protein n=1 Tax=Albula glossodonta TaxID=121402 RepID=A0A8T2NCF5_9TELE|nr:hypothetical protein JZ751_009059 [Albula glossodonta]
MSLNVNPPCPVQPPVCQKLQQNPSGLESPSRKWSQTYFLCSVQGVRRSERIFSPVRVIGEFPEIYF